MKIRIEVDDRIEENEVIVRCNELNDEIKNIQKVLAEILSKNKQIIFYKGNTEYYISLEDILFFETEESGIIAHTINDMYVVKYKLYEL
ncbi:LytTR family transcriptional regulator, partial [Clostridium saudiense]|nr:LytTR family transcriptional regulator [Clostridium saudiense]